MKKERLLLSITLAAALGLLIAVAAYAAEAGPGGPGPGPGKHDRMKMYDPKTVETITGEVIKVKEFKHRRGTGIGLILKTEKEEIPVHIGPSAFLEKQGFKFGEKDKLEVTGSRVTGKRGKEFLLAAQVKKGDALLTLRDETGKPVWAPMRDRRMKEEAPKTEPKPEPTK